MGCRLFMSGSFLILLSFVHHTVDKFMHRVVPHDLLNPLRPAGQPNAAWP